MIKERNEYLFVKTTLQLSRWHTQLTLPGLSGTWPLYGPLFRDWGTLQTGRLPQSTGDPYSQLNYITILRDLFRLAYVDRKLLL